MKTNKNKQLVPVVVFQAGSMRAVLWQPLREVRKAESSRGYRVSLHTGCEPRAKTASQVTLMTVEQIPEAIDSLLQAKQSIVGECSRAFVASGMFVCAMDMLGAKAEW